LSVLAALRIILETTVYRVKRREANNLLTSVSLMLAFRLPWDDVLYRSVFAAVLNIYVYLINDYCDIDRDLASPQKDHDKARYMARNRGAAVGALIGLAALLVAGALYHSELLLLAFAANTVVVYTYSRWFKRMPVADVLIMSVCGVTISLVGLPEGSLLGWKMVGLLGFICASFEVIQVIRDEPGDRRSGVTTTAVLLGARASAWIFRAIVLGAAAYGVFVIGSFVPLALAPAVLFPLSPDGASRTWDWCRVLFGGVWGGLLILVWLGYLS